MGIAGAANKCDFVTGVLGFDACVSHKGPDLPESLAAACPDGIDAYFENVGGQVFEAVLPLLNPRSRISLCGLVSQYGNPSGEDPHEACAGPGPTDLRTPRTSRRINLSSATSWPRTRTHSSPKWPGGSGTGLIKYKEDLWPGLQQAPTAFRAMLEGGNFGKTLVGVGDDPTLDEGIKARRASHDVLGTAS